MLPLSQILLNSCTSWLLPLPFSLSLMHFSDLLPTDSSNLGAKDSPDCETDPTGMMDRPVMVVNQGHTLKAQMSLKGLCSANSWADSSCVINKALLSSWQPQDKILAVYGVWRAGKRSSPQLQQDKFLPISREAAAVPRQSPRHWQLCQWSPHILVIVFSHFFLFSHTPVGSPLWLQRML